MTESQAILEALCNNEIFTRRVIPFIKPDYFETPQAKEVFKVQAKYFADFNSCITPEALAIELGNAGLPEKLHEDARAVVEQFSDKQQNLDWLIKTSETWCRDRAIYNAITKAIDLTEKKKPDSIPLLLQEALAVTFDTSVGHDYLEDTDLRYEFYHRDEQKIPFGITALDGVTNGGPRKKSLVCIMAGCVHPDTKVTIRFRKRTTKTCCINELKTMLELGYEIEIDSPDGWVGVNYFIDKGEWDEYILRLEDGSMVRCNENHLFETPLGWQFAEDLAVLPDQHYLTKSGFVKGSVYKTGNRIPIVDINVEHDNHRYYTNGVSSHNTGAGKSALMTSLSAFWLTQGLNVLYISLEMAQELIAERIDANLMDVPIHQLSKLSKDRFESLSAKVKSKARGRLIVKDMPTSSVHTGHIRTLIQELQTKKKFKPDVICVDYINLLLSQRFKGGQHNSYTLVKSAAEELRGLAMELDVPIITATQLNRGGIGATDVDMTDTSESMGLVHSLDAFIALIATEELEAMNQVLIKVLKNRWGENGGKFMLGVDRPKMRFYDLDGEVAVEREEVVTTAMRNQRERPSKQLK